MVENENFYGMIIGKLSESARYYALHPLFRTAFEYFAGHDLLTAPTGRIAVDGDKLFINNNLAELRPECLPVEAHRRYIDIQVVLSGEETFGWVPVDNIAFNPYDPDREVMLSDEKAELQFTLRAGEFAIFFPEDGHAPQGGPAGVKIRKAIAKVETE